MTPGSFFLVLITAACMAVANLLMRAGLLKLGGQFSLSLGGIFSVLRQPLYLSGITLVGLAGIMWCRILASERLTLSYPLFVSLTYAFMTLGAVYFLDEKMSFQKLLALALILAGIVMLKRP